MGEKLIKYCDRHPDMPLEAWDPMVGDHNAQPIAIVFADSTYDMFGCRDCVAELREWIGPRPPSTYSGTVRGKDKMRYAPRVDASRPVRGWQLLPTLRPPDFQG